MRSCCAMVRKKLPETGSINRSACPEAGPGLGSQAPGPTRTGRDPAAARRDRQLGERDN